MSICERCGATFECGMVDNAQAPCWCTQLPPLPSSAYVRSAADGTQSRCFCPACLRVAVMAQDAAPRENS
ncbi:MAG TPA: cysteine-rich CWC family protein [Noviherbaspirillum sp.]|nr:cysteine-rich CWC family protein [Noviherbaspirillum sp.]